MEFPAAGGDLSRLLEGLDWTASPLGPPASWSAALRSTVRLILPSQAQIVLFWGEQYVALYNAAYAPTIGMKHPQALGRPAAENWSELWDDLEPLLAEVRTTGETVHAKSRPFYIERFGYPETVYFDISYSAVLGEAGSVEGVLCIVTETTGEVRAQAELREQGERLSELFRQAPGFICALMGERHRIEVANDSYRQLVGGRELIGRTVAEALPEVVGQGFIDLLDQVYRSGQPYVASEAPIELAQPGGRRDRRFLDFVYQPIRDREERVIGILVQGLDVTDRTLAAQRQRLLVNELNHRVKNSLATVQSIVMQTLRSAPDLDTARNATQDRILSLAAAHDMLTRESWSGAELEEVVQRALSPFSAGDRISIAGASMRVAPNQALALSLAFHELATNASKYGALSNALGRVTVSWAQQPGKSGVTIAWRESAGPAVTTPSRRGFGSRLIERGLGDELGGRVTLEYQPQGVACEIELPDRTAHPQPLELL